MTGERAHGELAASPLPDSKLGFEIFKAIKAVGSIEFCMIFAVTAFNLIVVTRRIRPDSKALKSSVTRRNTCNYRPSIFVCLG